MFIKKVLFHVEKEAGTGLRAMATMVVEAQVELMFSTDIRIPGLRVVQGANYYRVEFPEGIRIDSEQWRKFFEQEVLFRYGQWLEKRQGDQAPFAVAA